MHRLLQGAGIGLLAFFVGIGCSSSEQAGGGSPTEPPVAPEAAGIEDEELDFERLSRPLAIPGLTSPTDPDAIVAEAGREPGRSRGVQDPFEPIEVGARFTPVEEETAPVEEGERTVAAPTASSPGPDRARAVRISGVVQVNDTVRVIVDDPNEPTSRHVGAGQFIADGQVLVKRIDINAPTPTVVLEEVGIEVVKSVNAGRPESEMGDTGAVSILGTGASAAPIFPQAATAASVPPPPPLDVY